MGIFSKPNYSKSLRSHYEAYFGCEGTVKHWNDDPNKRLPEEFFVLEIAPNKRHNMWSYLTVGMSATRNDDNLIELVVYSAKQNDKIVELLALNTSFHHNSEPLNVHHTVNIGQPWIDSSNCDHGFISLPYLDGKTFEHFVFRGRTIHCYWFIPITELERDYKIEEGCEALEQLFEDYQLDYLNPNRECLIEKKNANKL